MKPFRARCYVMPKEGLFYAACLTLNLSAVGETLDEAKSNLDETINEYMRIATEGREYDEFRHLIRRPAPLFMYVDYLVCFAVQFLDPRGKHLRFQEPLPLTICYTH